MNEQSPDLETMQAELEAAGYEYAPRNTYVAPNGRTFFDGANLEHSIGLAYAHLQQQRELETLRTLFDLCVRTFDYPREVEMLGAGLTDAEREMLYQAFETRRKELDTHTEDNNDE